MLVIRECLLHYRDSGVVGGKRPHVHLCVRGRDQGGERACSSHLGGVVDGVPMGAEADREALGDITYAGVGLTSRGGEEKGLQPLGGNVCLQLSKDGSGKGMQAIILPYVGARVEGRVEDSRVGDGDQDRSAEA